MGKGRLLFVPSGGLANRMRAIASAYTLTQQTDSELQIVWFCNQELNAPFRSIFNTGALPVREATWTDKICYDRARRKNFYLPALPQRLLFDRRIGELEVTPLKEQGFNFEQWLHGHHCYMNCYQVFGSFPDSLYKELFQPVREITDTVERNKETFSPHTIGLHIRRTDHTEAARRSPIDLFIKSIKQEIETHDDARFFLATDSNEVKQQLSKLFGQRIITPAEEAKRDSIDGIRGGLADMWTLAATQRIYGSALSSFSPMAASIGGIPLTVIDTDAPVNIVNYP